MAQQFISMKPDPRLVRKALDHCGVPLDYTDEHTVKIPSGPGFDSNGNMTIPEGHVLIAILQSVIDGAMTKYVEDTMVLPSNVDKLHDIRNTLRMIGNSRNLAQDFGSLAEVKEIAEDLAEQIDGIATNLDPRKH